MAAVTPKHPCLYFIITCPFYNLLPWYKAFAVHNNFPGADGAAWAVPAVVKPGTAFSRVTRMSSPFISISRWQPIWRPAVFILLAALLLWAGGLTICPFRALTGLPCLTCGMTHAWAAFLSGHFRQAFQYHPCFPLALPAVLAWAGRHSRFGRVWWQSRVFWLSLLAALLLCHAVRMTVCFPDGPYPMTKTANSLLAHIPPLFNPIPIHSPSPPAP